MMVELRCSVTSFQPWTLALPVASEFAPSAVARVRVETTTFICSTIAFKNTLRPVRAEPDAISTWVKAAAAEILLPYPTYTLASVSPSAPRPPTSAVTLPYPST